MGYKPQANPHLTTGLLSSCQKCLEIQKHLFEFTICKSYGNLDLIPQSKLTWVQQTQCKIIDCTLQTCIFMDPTLQQAEKLRRPGLQKEHHAGTQYSCFTRSQSFEHISYKNVKQKKKRNDNQISYTVYRMNQKL